MNWIISILMIFLLIRLYIDHFCIKTTQYEIKTKKISQTFDGYKIIQLSDLHGIKLNQQIIRKIQREKPDMIVMTGDMVSSSQTNFDSFYELTKLLVKDFPVYYIIGNHEGRMPQEYREEIMHTLKKLGVIVLHNESYRIEKQGEYLNLYGMWIHQRFYSKDTKDNQNVLQLKNIQKLLGNCHTEDYNILLIHTPLFFPAYAEWGADLIFCGHIHGGLIRIPFLGGFFSPHRVFFPQYDYGKFEEKQSTMILSSGLSRGEAGFRFLNRPEIVSVTLRKE